MEGRHTRSILSAYGVIIVEDDPLAGPPHHKVLRRQMINTLGIGRVRMRQ